MSLKRIKQKATEIAQGQEPVKVLHWVNGEPYYRNSFGELIKVKSKNKFPFGERAKQELIEHFRQERQQQKKPQLQSHKM